MGVGRLERVHGKDARGSTVTEIRIMTDDQILEVVHAVMESRKIQCQSADGNWYDLPILGVKLDFATFDYRVAHEPKEWWLDFHNGGKSAEVYNHNYCGDCVLVREVEGATSVKPTVDASTVKASQETIPESRKPREWWLCDGIDHKYWIIVDDKHTDCRGELVRVREVLENE